MTFHELPTSLHLSFSVIPTVPFLFQASTCALEGLKDPGTRLPSGPACECSALACLLGAWSTWVPGLLRAVLYSVTCWEWGCWAESK